MIEQCRADEVGEGYREDIAGVLAHGFAEDFAFFSPDPARVAAAFAHMLILERFYVALVDGHPAAVASLTTGEQECFALVAAELRAHLGAIRGSISYQIVRSQFLGAYPEPSPDLAEIGFVTTAPGFRRRGLARALMQHLVSDTGFQRFVLRDIKDTNQAALQLYRGLGFREYERRPVRFARRAGFHEYLSLRLETDSAGDS
ncbi:GNAT family N-acetyltransferase [Glutamicibacter endophyticus]|uniref:GNAT family N-acetyltransferase n=1 Tax=Glutamicibacter endophyticus TaxID=1522174 RepID=UPI003AEF7C65